MHTTCRFSSIFTLSFALSLTPSTTESMSAEPVQKTELPFNAPPKEFECRWADGPITIDGKADEPAWKDAQFIDKFYLPWLGKNARLAKTKTAAKLLWDREYLYFFAEMEDHDLFADVTEHDGMTWLNDVFELFFKPAAATPGYYEFNINAAGTVMDMFLPSRDSGGYQRYKSDGAFHVDAKVVLRGTLNKRDGKDEGWSVEGRIPWTDFMRTGGRPDVNEEWKFALCRFDYTLNAEPEPSTCAPLSSKNVSDFHAHEDYATLKFVGPPATSRKPYGIAKREPLTTSTVLGSPDPPPPYRALRVYPKLEMSFPIDVKHIPGSDQFLYITEKESYGNTVIRRMKDDPNVAASETVLPLDGVAYQIVFHPQFEKNGYVYVGWNGPGSKDKRKHSKVSRWTMLPKAPYTLDKSSETLIIEWPSDGHNGAAVCFGLDGMLYVTSGDGTSDSDGNVMGQRMDVLLSKVLRIDVDHPEEGKAYSVPKDNPFVGQKDICAETWAYGLRNPWRIHCDRKTGHIWVGNNGQDLWEQVYFVRKGENYGWSVYEGSHPFYPERKLGPTPPVKPTLEHHHSEARSMTGGVVYYGSKHPELVGAYVYGDYSTGRVWAARHDGEKVIWHKELAQTHLHITGFGVDGQGEILICDHNGNNQGGFYTLVAGPKDPPPSTFPKTLSASGLFKSVRGHQMQPGMIPYSVNAQLWSDGAFKSRWLGLPGLDPKIDFTRLRGWNFPDRTVIVKSFALEMEEGKPQSRRWIETRFLTRQDGEWSGYSYLWNEEQNEGALVDAKGLDRDYTISTKDGKRTQKWHYPSRAECMVCHSREANWVLGLSAAQLNKDHDYGGCTDNQLRVLEHLGLFQAFDYGKHVQELNPAAAKLAAKNQRAPAKTAVLPFNPSAYPKLADPYDKSADLDKRARAYLHSNCAHCHVFAGGGNSQINLEWNVSVETMKMIDVKPQHHSFNLPDAKLIAAGHPEQSVLLHRVGIREAGFMPPLATSIVDRQAVEMLREWIAAMPARNDP
jgi:uncharacterized repeat protein (TIGR03806 family)